MRHFYIERRSAIICGLVTCFLGMVFVSATWAEIKVNDHFDAGELDPSWEVTLELATGWTYELASSWLTVSEIQFEEMHGGWSDVNLGQEFEPLDDFSIRFDLAWDSAGSNSAMQNLGVVLYDLSDEYVVYANYHDAWDANQGRVTAIIGEDVYNGPNDLPHNGTGTFEIVRTGGVVTIFWEDGEVISGPLEAPVKRLELRFQVAAWPTGTFGELSVDLVSCEGDEATPNQNSAWGSVKSLFR